MPDAKSTDPNTRIALLERENISQREMIDALRAKVVELDQRLDADHVKIAQFDTATKTGKWVVSILFAAGTLALGFIAVSLTRGGQP